MGAKEIRMTGSGFVAEILFIITNGIYFRFEKSSEVVARNNGIEYTLESAENALIKESKALKLKCGVFDSSHEAMSNLATVMLNLQLYLCSICARYEIRDTYISDLSVIEMRDFLCCDVNMSLLRPWDMPDCTSMKLDEKATKAMNLYKMATEAKDTSVAFLLLVIALEALTKVAKKDDVTCKLLYGFIEQINTSDLEQSRKDALRTTITNLQDESATNAIKRLIMEHKLEDRTYGNYSAMALVSKSYGLRSSFAHNGVIANAPSSELRMLLTDVLRAYMKADNT